MSKRIEFSDDAKVDYRKTFAWYAKQNAVAALRFSQAVDEAAERVAADPQRFPSARPGYRFCILKRFPLRLVYREEATRIFIVAIFHGKRHSRHSRRRS